jgi:hypothetical protein
MWQSRLPPQGAAFAHETGSIPGQNPHFCQMAPAQPQQTGLTAAIGRHTARNRTQDRQNSPDAARSLLYVGIITRADRVPCWMHERRLCLTRNSRLLDAFWPQESPMSDRPIPACERKKEAPPAGQRDNAADPIVTDDGIAADNRYAPASGILTPIQAPMSGAQD